MLHIVGLCSEHAANPLHNCLWSSFLSMILQGVFEDNVESIPSLSCIKGLKSENVAMLTKNKLLLYNFYDCIAVSAMQFLGSKLYPVPTIYTVVGGLQTYNAD